MRNILGQKVRLRTVLQIFTGDIRSLSRRFFALAIIVAVCVLPALYAWVNIYANGDPYAATGEIKIALASLDPGIDLEDGSHINMSEEVFDELKGNDKIGWQFPSDAGEAIEGVRSGEYYAAIIFEDNFTYDMYHFEQALIDQKAPLVFYENAKKNAVASKITETAAANVQESIKTKYLEAVFSQIFDESNDLAEDIENGDVADTVISQLEGLRDTLREYDSAISSFMDRSGSIHSGLSGAGGKLAGARRNADKSAAAAESDLKKARSSLAVLQKVLESREKRIEKERAALEKTLEKIIAGGLSEEEKQALLAIAREQATVLKADLEGFLALLPESGGTNAVKTVRAVLTSMIADIDVLIDAMEDPVTAADILEELKKLSQTSLSESVASLIAAMDRTVDLMEPLMLSMSGMLDDIGPVLDGADDTISGLETSLLQMQDMFRATADKVDGILDKVQKAKEEDKLGILVDLLGGDPAQYAAFFSSLVDVDVEEVYSVASYGAAMTPFYSVLAIWVGGVILVSILKTHIDRKKFPDATDAEAFFGRYLLFYLVGQAQAAVIVAGDIFMLGCAPAHPWLMWLSASVASFVFVMLVYALTLSFGDVGKAIVVVVMVLQIAGSSGSYPIEILPPVFGKIYKFFPFPYAINAMREALCGTYGHDFAVYLGELLLFAVLALAIGLLIRKPFMGMNRFVSEKIEETEVL